MGIVEIQCPHIKQTISYHLNDRLKKNLDKKVIGALAKNDKDYVMAIDGAEGSGKSTLALQIGKYVDPTLDLSRVVFDAESFKEAVYKAKKGQCIIYDEAFTGLSSRSSLSGINRFLVSLMMQMRQKNLFIIVVLPTIFLLDKYVALFRARVLIHVYENHGRRGYFRVYNQKIKKTLYLEGKQTYSYKVYTGFKGQFYGVFALGTKELDKKYRKMKEQALEATEKNPMTSTQVKNRDQRDICLFIMRKKLGLSYREMSELLAGYDFIMSHMQIRDICVKFGDHETEKDRKEILIAQSAAPNEEIPGEERQSDGIEVASSGIAAEIEAL